MNKEKFLTELTEELELESKLSLDTKFKELEEWDSMGAMVLIGYVADEFDVTLNANDIGSLTDINSLIELIGAGKFI